MSSNDLFALNVTGIEPGKFASNLGTAHELVTTGIIMRWGFDVSVSGVRGGPYDLLITAYADGVGSSTGIIKAQTKTCTSNECLKFVGGTRGGRDRSYTSERKPLISKTYVYSEDQNDLIIGVDRRNLDLYLVPTFLVFNIGKSISIRRIPTFRNRWEILLNWRREFLEGLSSEIR